MCIPGFKKIFRSHLYAAKKDLVCSPNRSALLRIAFAEETFLDWAKLPGLSAEAVMEALHGPELSGTLELSLCPDWTNTSATDLAEVVCMLTCLETLYIMESPTRADEGPIGEFHMTLGTHLRRPVRILLTGASSQSLNKVLDRQT